jgi:hypothetical protein
MKWWQKKVLSFQSKKDKWSIVFFMTIFVPVFLIVFQPFGVNNFNPKNSLSTTFVLSMFGFGAVQGIVFYIFEFIIVPGFFYVNTWLVFIIRMITELICIASAMFLFYNYMGDFHDWHFSSFLEFIFNVILMSIIPLAIIFLYLNYRATQKAYRLLEQLPKSALSEKYINLESNNKKSLLSITLDDLLFIEAQDNYVSIHFIDKNTVKRKLLRATMKEIEVNLKSEFVERCHRSFIVNINKVERVVKEGHQMKLYLTYLSPSVPVSRSYIPKISSLLDAHHK